MNSAGWTQAVSGAIAFACAAIGFFFLRFWRRTHDRLFLIPAVSFWLLLLERLFIIAAAGPGEASPFIYTVRLLAFLLIIYAVVDKNRKQGPH